MATRFLGNQYPLVKTSRGIMAQKKGVDQIKADLLQLLLTNPGERVMMPTYGTPLRKLLFEQNDRALELQAQNVIAEAIANWEPRVIIQNISVEAGVDRTDSRLHRDDTGEESENILMITIEFVDPENISEVEALVLEVPLQR